MNDSPSEISHSLQALTTALHVVLEASTSDEMIGKILHSVQELVGSEAASLFLIDPKRKMLRLAASTNLPISKKFTIEIPVGTGVAGWVALHGISVNIEDMSQDSRFYRAIDSKTGFQTKGYLCVPLKIENKIIGTVQVLNRIKGGRFTDIEQIQLECFSLLVALAFNKSQLHESETEKNRLEHELQIAELFQQRLLPSQLNPPPELEIYGFNKVARNLGGDYYDTFETEHGFCFVIADVSGKGPSAALWMSGLSNLLRLIVADHEDPLTELPRIDAHFARQFLLGTYITIFLASYSNGTLRYLSAGHNPMAFIKPDGSLVMLRSTGIPIGILPSAPRIISEVPFPTGSMLVLFTDGVTEAENEEGTMFTEKRLVKVISKHQHLAPEQLANKILSAIDHFIKEAVQSDDITLLIVKAK